VKRGNVVLMVVPGELGKPRPGVIVQADELGDSTTSVVVCLVSSDIREGAYVRPIVEPTAGNGLRLTSQIMTDKLLALRRDRVRRVIGHLDSAAGTALDRALMIVLGLAR
jgi:mRNA interferase MazF